VVWPNHALQRTRHDVVVCNHCVPRAGSLSLGRSAAEDISMTMSLPVRDVLRSPLHFRRGHFGLAVIGLLAAKPGDCRIFDDNAALDDLTRAVSPQPYEPDPKRVPSEDVSIRIDDPTFMGRLMAEVSTIDDSEYLFFDTAMICASTRIDPGEIVLEHVWDVCLVRDGNPIWAFRAIDDAEPAAAPDRDGE